MYMDRDEKERILNKLSPEYRALYELISRDIQSVREHIKNITTGSRNQHEELLVDLDESFQGLIRYIRESRATLRRDINYQNYPGRHGSPFSIEMSPPVSSWGTDPQYGIFTDEDYGL
jgi:hypothetical protein